MARNVLIDIIGRDQASPAFNRAAASANRAGNAVATSSSKMSTAMRSAAVTAGKLGVAFGAFEVVKGAIDITKEAANFQRDMTKIQTQAGASASEVKSFSGQVLGLAGKTAQAPEDLALSLFHVYSATKTLGYTGPQMLKAVQIAAEGATASGANLEDTTNALTATMVSGLGSVNNMSKAMGALNAIVGAGDMKLSDLNEALGTGILAVAKSFGVTLNQAGAALAVFGDNNIRGADAATKLRMAIMDLSKPGAHGAEVLDTIGLSVTALRDDLAKGGLTLALHDLKNSLQAAGVTGNKVGGFIEDAFTKRAGAGLTILLRNLNQYDEKQLQIANGAGKFGAAWQATTQTAACAWKSFTASLKATGVQIASNVLPELTSAAQWLGKELPLAVTALTGILGGPLTVAWHALATAVSLLGAVLSPVIAGLAKLGSYLGAHSSEVKQATGLVLGLWAAYKGYTIAVAAINAVKIAMAAYKLEMVAVNVGAAGVGNSLRMFVQNGGPAAAAFVAVGVAVAIAGHKLSDWIEAGDSGAKVFDQLGAGARNWTSALQASNGALDANVAKTVAATLQQSGLASKAAAANISLNELTYGVTHGKAAFDDLIATWKAGGKPSDDTIHAAGLIAGAYGGVAARARELAGVTGQIPADMASVGKAAHDAVNNIAPLAPAAKAAGDSLKWVVDSTGNFIQTTQSSAAASKSATAALQAQTVASQQLKTAQDLLNGVNESVETSTNGFTIALGGLANKTALFTDANGKLSTSLSRTTVAGATNRNTMVSLLDTAKAQAQAVADLAYQHSGKLGPALAAGNTALANNESAIRAAAKAAGLDTDQVNGLIKSIGKLSTAHANPKINADTTAARTSVHDLINDIDTAKAVLHVSVSTPSGTSSLPIGVRGTNGGALAAGGPMRDGWSTVGEGGPGARPELVYKRGPMVHVVSAAKAPRVAAMLGLNAPGLRPGGVPVPAHASGTVDTSGVSGAIGNVGSAYSTPIDVASTGINRILGQLAKAGDALNKAISKGLGAAAANAFRSQIAALRAEAERQLKALKQKIVTTDVSVLKSALTQTRTETEAAMRSLITDAKHAGASDSLIDKLVGKENKLLGLQKQRNSVAKSITAEQAKLNSLQSKYADVYNSTKSATLGSFDITTAGQSDAVASTFGDQPGTAAAPASAGSILSSLQKTAANAAKFGGILKRLIKAGLNKTLVLQLAQAGPSALAQAQALAAATPAQMKSLNASYGQLDSAASVVGKVTATNMYGAGIQSAQGIIKGLQSKESALNKAMKHLAKQMVDALKNALGIHSPSRVMRGLAHNTAEGYRLGLVDRLEHVAKAGKDLGNAGVPNGQTADWQRQTGHGGNLAGTHHHHYQTPMEPDAMVRAIDRHVQFAGLG